MTTILDDMIERVARAIADNMHAGGDFGMTGADAYRRRSAEFMSLARTAIEAMQPAISVDVMREAAKHVECYAEPRGCIHVDDDGCGDECAVKIMVSNAILAERERCAKTAERFCSEREPWSDGGTRILRAVYGPDIATAIRSQS